MNAIADRIQRGTACAHGQISLACSSLGAHLSFCSVHSPPFTHLYGSWDAQRGLRNQFRDCALLAVERPPPRGVTVFAERVDEPGASGPQKRRRHFTPSRACRFVRRISFVSTAHAPSRRLQRVSVSCTRVPRGQASRRRPGHVGVTSPKCLGVLNLREAVGV